MPAGPTRVSASERKEVPPPGGADDTNASMSFAHGLLAYVAGPFRAPVKGLERP